MSMFNEAPTLAAHLAAGGSEPDDTRISLTFADKAGKNHAEWPPDLRVQEFPTP